MALGGPHRMLDRRHHLEIGRDGEQVLFAQMAQAVFNDIAQAVPTTAIGSSELLRLTTSAPLDDPGPFIDDVFLESFDDNAFEAALAAGGVASRASR